PPSNLFPYTTLFRSLLMRGLQGFGREQQAQALIEFALMLPVFLLLVTGIFDTARAVWQENTLAYAAREGTRYAIVHGTGGIPVEIGRAHAELQSLAY